VQVRFVVSAVGILAGETMPARFALITREDFTQPPTTASWPASPRPPSGWPTTERSVARFEYSKHWIAELLLLGQVSSADEPEAEDEDRLLPYQWGFEKMGAVCWGILECWRGRGAVNIEWYSLWYICIGVFMCKFREGLCTSCGVVRPPPGWRCQRNSNSGRPTQKESLMGWVKPHTGDGLRLIYL
jgi:hypothetical protein